MNGISMATILIVDDSKFSRRAVRRILTNYGYDILEASDGIEALEVISEKNPDCMVLDLLMPNMGGKETLSELSKRGINLSVVVLTTDVQSSVKEECLKLGACELFNKPPDWKDFIKAIEKAIGSTERVVQ